MTNFERAEIRGWCLSAESTYSRLVEPEWNFDLGITKLRNMVMRLIESGEYDTQTVIELLGVGQIFYINSVEQPEVMGSSRELDQFTSRLIRDGKLGRGERKKVTMIWEHEVAHLTRSREMGVGGRIVVGASDNFLVGAVLQNLEDLNLQLKGGMALPYLMGSVSAAPATADTWHYEEEDKLAARLLLVARNRGSVLTKRENLLVEDLGYKR